MALIMVPYAARTETPFPECTSLVAADERGDVIALAWHDGYLADSARAVYQGHSRNAIGIYDARTRALLARFHTRWEVNAIALHPTRDELAIGAGSYDGGYMFEGQLLIWNWRTGASHSELTENREARRVVWHGDELEVNVAPATDEDPTGEMTFELRPARAGDGTGWSPDESSNADPRLEPSRGRPATEPEPNPIYDRYDAMLERHTGVTAIEWVADGRVAIGTVNGRLLLWEPATNRTQELSVDRRVTGLWRHDARGLLVLVETHQRISQLFALAGTQLELVKSFTVPHTCSVDRRGRILCRSIETRTRRKSTILEPDGTTTELALGGFDVFNHFIRLDGGDELYFLQGDTARAHERKRLCAITPSGDIEVRMPWDGEALHTMSSIGVLVGDGRLARGFLVHNPKGSRVGIIELCELTGRSLWRHEIAGGIAAMAIWQGCVVAGLLDGTFLALDLDTGKVVHDEPFVFGSSRAMVTAIAVHDEAIALGSVDGRVSIVTSR